MFYSKDQLWQIGFKSFGENVLISDKCSIYNAEKIEIGSNVRIDDFCILSAGEGGIVIGDNIHIACYVSLIGAERIQIDDFAQVAQKTSILSSTDDFSGEYLVGPTVPNKYRRITSKPVHLKKHAVIGANSVVLPGVTFGEGGAVGALSLVKSDVEAHKLYGGSPLHFIKDRSYKMDAYSDSVYEEHIDWYK